MTTGVRENLKELEGVAFPREVGGPGIGGGPGDPRPVGAGSSADDRGGGQRQQYPAHVGGKEAMLTQELAVSRSCPDIKQAD